MGRNHSFKPFKLLTKQIIPLTNLQATFVKPLSPNKTNQTSKKAQRKTTSGLGGVGVPVLCRWPSNYRCFLEAFDYIKTTRKHLLEGLGRSLHQILRHFPGNSPLLERILQSWWKFLWKQKPGKNQGTWKGYSPRYITPKAKPDHNSRPHLKPKNQRPSQIENPFTNQNLKKKCFSPQKEARHRHQTPSHLDPPGPTYLASQLSEAHRRETAPKTHHSTDHQQIEIDHIRLNNKEFVVCFKNSLYKVSLSSTRDPKQKKQIPNQTKKKHPPPFPEAPAPPFAQSTSPRRLFLLGGEAHLLLGQWGRLGLLLAVPSSH